jgi:hypothetical protein
MTQFLLFAHKQTFANLRSIRPNALPRNRAYHICKKNGWGGRDRTCEYRYQKAVPYHLATPQQRRFLTQRGRLYSVRAA